MGNVWRWIWLVHNVTLVLPHSVLYVLAYLGWLLLVLPLRVLHPPLYWTLEGYLYNLVLAVVGGYVHQAGIPVVEEGEDVNVYANDQCLVIVNHQDSLDVPILILALQAKRNVCRHMTWVIDAMFKYSNFGFVGGRHGDIFIESGKAAREKSLQVLKQCLEEVYLPRGRQWLMLFPEGGYLRNMKPGSIKFAAEHGYPVLENVALPRVGALKTILDVLDCHNSNTRHQREGHHDLRQLKREKSREDYDKDSTNHLKWIIDVTIGYPSGRPLTVVDCILCRSPSRPVSLHYRVYSVNDVPRDTAALTQWIYDRYVEKDAMLAEYVRTGHFPRVHTSSSNTSMSTANTSVDSEGVRERYLTVTNTLLVLQHLFWLVSCYVQYHMVRYTLATVWSLYNGG